MADKANTADILILGAGCAGTLLATFLEYLDCRKKIVLLDARTKFDREQRWCGWAKLPDFLQPVVTKSWKNWMVCDEEKTVTRNSTEYLYQEIYAPKFYEYLHGKLKNSESEIEFAFGEKVSEVTEIENFVEVKTDKKTWQAKLVFDARNEGSLNYKNLETKGKFDLQQIFSGLELEFEKDVFDVETAVLMDFRTAQFDGLNFLYVLPYTPRKAFFESTSFTLNSFDKEKHKQAILDYAAKHFGEKFSVGAEEIGALPMTIAEFPVRQSKRFFSIGAAGGFARPSSAYAFHRTLRQTEKIAEAIVGGKKIPTAIAAPKYDFLDAVLLEAIERAPNVARKYFVKLFDEVKPESVIRFMLDESSSADDFAVMNIAPKIRFGIFTLQSLKKHFNLN